eukprot:scaffold376867_cov29-Prasinocladus_malaysianus.AAC.1
MPCMQEDSLHCCRFVMCKLYCDCCRAHLAIRMYFFQRLDRPLLGSVFFLYLRIQMTQDDFSLDTLPCYAVDGMFISVQLTGSVARL